jgi:uncharacterized delta-60 repeat protein
MKNRHFWLYLMAGCPILGLLLLFLSCGHPLQQTSPIIPSGPIVSVFPEDKSNIPKLDIVVSATFNRAMDASSITASTFTLTSPSGAVTGTVSYEPAGKTATFVPLSNLISNNTYNATISDSVKESNGKKLDAPYSWSFITSSATITGTPDASFGSGGTAIIDPGAEVFAVDNSGRIIVAGTHLKDDLTFHMAVWRYNPDGTPDINFGTGGISLQPSPVAGGRNDGNLHDSASAIILDSDERILVAGYGYDPDEKRVMAVWRLDPDGSLDTSFNGSGVVLHPGPTEEVSGWVWKGIEGSVASIALDPANRILITSRITKMTALGISPINEEYYMITCRYNPNGSPDSSFSDGTHEGFVLYPGSGNALAANSSGKILVAGSTYEYIRASTGMRIFQINSDGKLAQTTDLFDDRAGDGFCIKVDSSDAILVGGSRHSAGGAIWKFDPSGNLDATFGQSGIVDLGNGRVYITLDSAGRILGTRLKIILTRRVGDTDHYQYFIDTCRLLPNGTTDESFGIDGKIIYPDYSPPEDIVIVTWGIQTDLYGRILVLGKSIQGSSPQNSIFRYK